MGFIILWFCNGHFGQLQLLTWYEYGRWSVPLFRMFGEGISQWIKDKTMLLVWVCAHGNVQRGGDFPAMSSRNMVFHLNSMPDGPESVVP